MREIKFRAWDKNHKKMINVIMGFVSEEEYNHEQDRESSEVFEWLEIYEVMQFTGLKDKNGKEIYEGDVVEEETESGVLIYEVFWSKYDCSFQLRPFSKKITKRDSDNDNFFHSLGTLFTDVSVVGNIHENPDLMR